VKKGNEVCNAQCSLVATVNKVVMGAWGWGAVGSS
jgi:hypothetical protein